MVLIIYIITLICLLKQYQTEKVYQIKEEIKIGFSIDYISRTGNKALRIFNTRDKGANLFTLDAENQKLIVVNRIDRETLCPKSLNTKIFRGDRLLLNELAVNCEIKLKLTLENSNLLDKIIIQIEDINDNAPIWKHVSTMSLVFVENEPIGTRKSLLEAEDLDIGVNGQISYSLESNYRSYFRLITDNGLYIENTQLLDREEKELYNLKLIASDNGNIIKSSEINLQIEITDVNDNSPRFTNSLFRPDKHVPENIRIGDTILQLTASDADKGNNGAYLFKMSSNTPIDITNLFDVKPDGKIIVKNSLDYDKGQSHFEFKVIVHDLATPPYRKSSEATVEIDIQDVNDEKPQIVFYAHKPSDGLPNSAMIDENADSMTPIGQLTVTDRDFKGTDKIQCQALQLNSVDNDRGYIKPILIIPARDPKEFQVVSNRKFDYEIEPVITSIIKCFDSADHYNKINITIYVQNLNDNKPDCGKSIYHVSINENEPIRSIIKPRLNIIDKDNNEHFNKNNRLNLKVQSPDDKYFDIDSNRQILMSRIKFDRERISSYPITILAIDNNNLQQSSKVHTTSCKVIVHIKDKNDNPVEINPNIYSFHVVENNSPGLKIGTIIATDLDNQTIHYRMDYKYRSKFNIDEFSGEISAKVSLDREESDSHLILVKATDGHYVATATVSIFVNDVNDNSPVFITPDLLNKVIQVNTREKPGYFIKKIKAEDKDSGNNGMVRYAIKRTSVKHTIFNLEPENGDLYLAVSLHQFQLITPSVSLDIEACDMGINKRCTTFEGLQIRWIDLDNNVGDSNSGGNYGSGLYNSSKFPNIIDENVLIGIISGLIILMIIILILFLIFRKKSLGIPVRNSRSDMNRPDKQLQKNLVTYPDNLGPPDYHCSTELAGLDRNDSRLASSSAIFPCTGYVTDTSKIKYGEPKLGMIDSTTASLTNSPISTSTAQRPSTLSPNNPQPLTQHAIDFSMRHQQLHHHHPTVGIAGSNTTIFTSTSNYHNDNTQFPLTTNTMTQFKQPQYKTNNNNNNNNNSAENYYSKYVMDRYLKISNTDPSICETLNNDSNNMKIANPKNESSFV